MKLLRWLHDWLRGTFPEPTWCGGCKKFSHGPCPSRECNE